MLFKVIAIRPRTGCADNLIKNLRPNRIYKLYNDYKYLPTDTDENLDCEMVEHNVSTPTNFYNIIDIDGRELDISVSAIVGKNGSGKSTLAEILFAAIFNFAFVNNLVPDFDGTGDRVARAKRVFVEVYYHIGPDIFKLSCFGKKVELWKQELGSNVGFSLVPINKKSITLFKEIFFYTIGINYSLFGLNQDYAGNWLQHVFHKNDGYRTPIVLNPYRENGTINVNREEYLTHSRLLANILSVKEDKGHDANGDIKLIPSYSELAPGRVVSNLNLKLAPAKTHFKDDDLQAAIMKFTPKIVKYVLSFYDINDAALDSKEIDVRLAFSYIAKKLFTISQNYERYKRTEFQFLKRLTFTAKGKIIVRYLFIESYLNNLLLRLKNDSSHINFKLTQSLNYLRNRNFYEKFLNESFSVEKLAMEIHLNIKGKGNLIDVLPPPFFDVRIQFTNGTFFDNLSSGEKQHILSSSAYIYHLININSINEGSEYCRYQFVNILFDEIELYYHPELQRTLVQDFLGTLKRLSVPHIRAINCTFITHSPFILSDIPNNNTIYLSETKIDGKVYSIPCNDKVESSSFGANIHELLTHSFFMVNTVGEFALDKINDLLKFSNEVVRIKNDGLTDALNKLRQDYMQKKDEYKFIYQNIGEDYLKGIIGNHLQITEEALDYDDFIDTKIKKYQQEIDKLKLLKKDAENKLRK